MCGILLRIETIESQQVKATNVDFNTTTTDIHHAETYEADDEVFIPNNSTNKQCKNILRCTSSTLLDESIPRTTSSWLKHRGPDHIGTYVTTVSLHDDADASSCACENNVAIRKEEPISRFKISFQASVLNMRDELVQQPYPLYEKGNDSNTPTDTPKVYLAWNGEVYQRIPYSSNILMAPPYMTNNNNNNHNFSTSSNQDENDNKSKSDSIEQSRFSHHKKSDYYYEDVWQSDVSDTKLVATLIEENAFPNRTSALPPKIPECEDYIAMQLGTIMSSLINAEYAFCLLTESHVYFGRDIFGRRSLLVGNTNDSNNKNNTVRSWCLSSVANTSKPATGMRWTEVEPGIIFCYEWSTNIIKSHPLRNLYIFGIPNNHAVSQVPLSLDDASKQLEMLLFDAVRRRLGTPSNKNKKRRVCLLFSGGLDSTVVAFLILKCIPSTCDGGNTILRLINVSFVNNNNEDKDITQDSSHIQLEQKEETQHTGTITKSDKQERRSHNKSKKTKQKQQQQDIQSQQQPPVAADTKAAQSSYEELKILYPNHSIEFVQYVADWDTIQKCEPIVRHLIHPKSTLMDVNISIALWLAASQAADKLVDPECEIASIGQNQVESSTTIDTAKINSFSIDNVSSTRILFTGLGADELMGGYGRHRKAWEQGTRTFKEKQQHGSDVIKMPGTIDNNVTTSNLDTEEGDYYRWQALRTELDFDLCRLWERNLGRDDRILSDHSLEVRLPFLDIHVVNFLRYTCPIQYLVDYTMDAGYGDKRILRLIAIRNNLHTGGNAIKRAIQFGSRISHVSDKQRFGSRRKASGDMES